MCLDHGTRGVWFKVKWDVRDIPLRLRSFLWERAVPAIIPGGTEPSVLKTGVYWQGTKPGPTAAEQVLNFGEAQKSVPYFF